MHWRAGDVSPLAVAARKLIGHAHPKPQYRNPDPPAYSCRCGFQPRWAKFVFLSAGALNCAKCRYLQEVISPPYYVTVDSLSRREDFTRRIR